MEQRLTGTRLQVRIMEPTKVMGLHIQIWLEDAQSVAEKVKLISKYELAGVAEWKLGFENSGIWSVITENLS